MKLTVAVTESTNAPTTDTKLVDERIAIFARALIEELDASAPVFHPRGGEMVNKRCSTPV